MNNENEPTVKNASDIVKKSVSVEDIKKDISRAVGGSSVYKLFYPHWIYISDEVRLELMRDGFKVYTGEWMRGDIGLIIEW